MEALGLQLRSIEEPGGAGGAAGMPAPTCYDAECARTEAWLDENQDFVHDYFLRVSQLKKIVHTVISVFGCLSVISLIFQKCIEVSS
ncbi:Dual 3',5'-cyclic-AMP and -GMP phosphodiesterase 11 [Eumeta japonica]|uniref:Dual 3',5'-cyclic-AMP and-GMP phosphodiesterase 11 n=1 Tax=Eumeta variegata TaxID=151549 RepID=A0A4C1VEA8_EUMVA|nr:Dual 3',5'-cyclic-AMP and -GMP phosphodiesterase 11 [Eumeta japonica]